MFLVMIVWNVMLLCGWYFVVEVYCLCDKLMCVILFGCVVVFVWLFLGGLFVFDDCCLYWYVLLFDGQFVGEILQCKYYGWMFGVDGCCMVMLGMCLDVVVFVV